MIRRLLPLVPVLSLVAIVAPAQEPTTVRPPELPVLPEDILETRVRNDGRRYVTTQELDPATMADKVEALKPPEPSPVEQSSRGDMEPEDTRPVVTHLLGASVFIPDRNHPERAITKLELRPPSGDRAVTLWANVNFLWLTGDLLETETSEARHSYLLMASEGSEEIPAGLQFPADGRPALLVTEGEPTGEELASLNALLGRYLTGQVQLRAAFERRQQEAEAAEAKRLAHPPEKKNMILRHWRTDEAGIRAAREGGAR